MRKLDFQDYPDYENLKKIIWQPPLMAAAPPHPWQQTQTCMAIPPLPPKPPKNVINDIKRELLPLLSEFVHFKEKELVFKKLVRDLKVMRHRKSVLTRIFNKYQDKFNKEIKKKAFDKIID